MDDLEVATGVLLCGAFVLQPQTGVATGHGQWLYPFLASVIGGAWVSCFALACPVEIIFPCEGLE